jgi:hypothetical protein
LRRAERKAAKAPRRQIGNAKAEVQAWGAAAAELVSKSVIETYGQTPGRGEIVGGEVSKLADKLAAIARKKGGTDAVQAELAQMIATARYEGQKAADDRHMKSIREMHEASTDKIVCSFIAVTEAEMKRGGGLPPAVTISSYTLCRMLDALNRAGYHADGKK